VSRKRRISSVKTDDIAAFRGFSFDCFIDTAINPVTKKQVVFTEPVVIKCYEDFAKFYDQWDKFCGDLSKSGCNPDEVAFSME
jgi:hypothetical protein